MPPRQQSGSWRTRPRRWVSVEEIAGHLGVARDTVYRWVDQKGRQAPAARLCSRAGRSGGTRRGSYRVRRELPAAKPHSEPAIRVRERPQVSLHEVGPERLVLREPRRDVALSLHVLTDARPVREDADRQARVGRMRLHHHCVLHHDASRYEIRHVLGVEHPPADPRDQFFGAILRMPTAFCRSHPRLVPMNTQSGILCDPASLVLYGRCQASSRPHARSRKGESRRTLSEPFSPFESKLV